MVNGAGGLGFDVVGSGGDEGTVRDVVDEEGQVACGVRAADHGVVEGYFEDATLVGGVHGEVVGAAFALTVYGVFGEET